MAKQGRGGLGLWDRLVLLVAWVVTCGLVYLLGIYVGKGMQERLLGHEERVIRLPVTGAPMAEGEKPKTEKELTFYDTLVRDADAGRAQTAPGPPARPAASGTPPATPARSAAAATPPATPTRSAAPATPPAAPARPAGAPAPPVPVVARPVPPGPAAVVRQTPPVRTPLPTPLPLPAPAAVPRKEPATATVSPPPAPEAAVSPPGLPGAPRSAGGNWTVLANPTRSAEEAEGLAQQLRGRGYAANVVSVAREGGTWYRVAVGRYASSEQATEMMQRLREREGVAHVFVAAE